MRISLCSVVVLTVLAAAPANAQSFNIHATASSLVPSSSYGAATGQAGFWTPVPDAPTMWSLKDLAGNTTAALARTEGSPGDSGCNVNGYGPDVHALFDSYVTADWYGTPTDTFVQGLLPGHYEATLYGAQCLTAGTIVYVTVNGGQFQVPVSGTYNGSFASMNLGRFSFDLTNSNSLTLRSHNTSASWCALQLTWFEFPTSYCTAKVNSLGCLPSIASTGVPSATATSGFIVTCSNVVNQKPGSIIYKVGGSAASLPFTGGTLCVGPTGIRRTITQSSGGSSLPAHDCSGGYVFDMNAFAQGALGGNPDPALLVPGSRVRVQWWGRDQGFAAPDNTLLSDGLEYDVRS
ncbi:MAG TPA: hypothetical protein VM509_07210 [Planctomycetota bacterium]|nr:hypothetical protein [Planctomycetota bacterium]